MPDAVIPVRVSDELDWDRLADHLRGTFDPPDAHMTVRQFAAGGANLTYLVRFGEESFVVRRPPRGTLAPGAHDMFREYRVLSKLADAYHRAPRALHFCDDDSVIGAPFVVLEYRKGIVIRDGVPESMAHHADVERRLDQALIDATADLHIVDPAAAGLGKLGRPDGFGQRQVNGWLERWRRVASSESRAVMDEVADRLAATLPEPSRVAVVHNDLKLDNCQFQSRDPDCVTSVLDWDMATIGDPLFDLGLLLVSMGSLPLWVIPFEEAVERYAQRTGIDVGQIDWYIAFATWRTAVVLQQLYNRFLAGDTTDDRCASFGAAIPVYAQRARDLIA